MRNENSNESISLDDIYILNSIENDDTWFTRVCLKNSFFRGFRMGMLILSKIGYLFV